MNCTIAVSSSSPPVRIDVSLTMPDSVDHGDFRRVPPPMSITMLPVGVSTGRPTPIAAAIGSATIEDFLRAGTEGRIANGTSFNFCNTRRHTDDDARLHLEDVVLDDQRVRKYRSISPPSRSKSKR